MPSLATIQQSIAQVLMRPLIRGEAMDPASAVLAAEIIQPNDRLSSFERLQIYNQQYWWRLLGNFAGDFSGLRAVLGQRKFDQLALAYLTELGSTSWNLRDLGMNLESFLQTHPELVAPHQRLATEMVQLEWARIEAFDGPEKPPIEPEKIARIAPDRLFLKLQPYLTLLKLEYPVDELMQKLSERSIETGSSSNAISGGDSEREQGERKRRAVRLSAKPRSTPIYLAVHRVDFSVYYKRLDARAYRLLMTLKGGASLEDACEEALQDWTELPENAAATVQSWFSTWMRFGWLCA